MASESSCLRICICLISEVQHQQAQYERKIAQLRESQRRRPQAARARGSPPAAALADIVLPIASCFEREALKVGFEICEEAQSLVQYRRAVVPPPGEARSDTEVIFDLAGRLGLAEQFWDGDAAYRHLERASAPG